MLKIAWAPIFSHPLPEGHRFPMEKYQLLPEQLIYEGTINESQLFEPSFIDYSNLVLTHKPEYIQKLDNLSLTASEIRKTGFPLSQELVNRERVIMQGTLDCALYALEYGVSMNIAGGTHHAYADRGEGFCLYNDQAIAANYLLNRNLAKQILIVDLDVHQGNGTAHIFSNEPRVYTFSMHGHNNYPLHKEESDCDIPLPDGIEDSAYLQLLDSNLQRIMDGVKPDFVFYQCGVDVLATDKLGKLKLSMLGCKERDRMVLDLCHKNTIPVVASMGGGYSKDIRHIVQAHAQTFRLAQEIWF